MGWVLSNKLNCGQVNRKNECQLLILSILTLRHLFQAIKELDYTVKDKKFIESMMDIEFADSDEKGVFYNGQSTSIAWRSTQLKLFDWFSEHTSVVSYYPGSSDGVLC